MEPNQSFSTQTKRVLKSVSSMFGVVGECHFFSFWRLVYSLCLSSLYFSKMSAYYFRKS